MGKKGSDCVVFGFVNFKLREVSGRDVGAAGDLYICLLFARLLLKSFGVASTRPRARPG